MVPDSRPGRRSLLTGTKAGLSPVCSACSREHPWKLSHDPLHFLRSSARSGGRRTRHAPRSAVTGKDEGVSGRLRPPTVLRDIVGRVSGVPIRSGLCCQIGYLRRRRPCLRPKIPRAGALQGRRARPLLRGCRPPAVAVQTCALGMPRPANPGHPWSRVVYRRSAFRFAWACA